jgi:DNA-binding NarL/FixJ family response regulator
MTGVTPLHPVVPLLVPDLAEVRARVKLALGAAGIVGVPTFTVPADGMARVEAIRSASDRHPIALMPAGSSGVLLRKAMRAGADGIVLDDAVEHALAPTIVAVLAGQIAVPAAMRRQIAPSALSHREKQVLALVVEGLTNRQIADRLFLAESTIKTHLSAAFDKLDAGSRAEATALILDPEDGRDLGVLAVAQAEGLTAS